MLTACDLGPYLSHHYVIFHFILEAYQLSSSINLIFLLKKKIKLRFSMRWRNLNWIDSFYQFQYRRHDLDSLSEKLIKFGYDTPQSWIKYTYWRIVPLNMLDQKVPRRTGAFETSIRYSPGRPINHIIYYIYGQC